MRHNLYRHRGVVRVKRLYVDQIPDWFREMMARMIVLRVDPRLDTDDVDFFALCEAFPPINEGSETPRYAAEIDGDDRFVGFA